MTVVDVVDVPVLPPAGPQIASLSRLPYWPSASGPDLTRGELLTKLLATVGLPNTYVFLFGFMEDTFFTGTCLK